MKTLQIASSLHYLRQSKRFRSLILSAFCCSLASCAGTSPYALRTTNRHAKVIVSITPFNSNVTPGFHNIAVGGTDRDDLNDLSSRSFRDFEELYLAAESAIGLGVSGKTSIFYLAPVSSPAADYTIDTSIIKSDGKNLSLSATVRRLDGVKIGHVRQNWYVLPQAASNPVDFIPKFTAEFCGAINIVIAKDNTDLDYLRAQVYAGKKLPHSENIVRIAREAAAVERENLLAPTTRQLASRARSIRPVYAQWQAAAYPFVTIKEESQSQLNSLNFQTGMGGVIAGQQIAQGNTSGGLESFSGTLQDVLPKIHVAESRMKSAQAVLSSQRATLNIGGISTVRVVLFNETHSLHGSLSEQLQQLRAIVREELLKASSEVAPRS